MTQATLAQRRRQPRRRGRMILTHDNGSTYAVYTSSDSTSVFGISHEEYEFLEYTREIGTFENFTRPRVGKGSVLVQTSADTFVHIGHGVFQFQLPPQEHVIAFRSPVRNADIAYPAARTNMDRVLILWDHSTTVATGPYGMPANGDAGSFPVLPQARFPMQSSEWDYAQELETAQRENPPRTVGDRISTVWLEKPEL